MNNVHCAMLIDDDAPTNFFHREVLLQAHFTKNILVFEQASLAIEYLLDQNREGALPEVIFLDLNMPGMDGWEFLEVYQEKVRPLYPKIRLIVMLTTSENPDTREKARKYDVLDTFMTKPLTDEKLNKLSSLI
jgi:CheY-like chemotaxis protein